ncbi:hypothetical protein C8J23_13639 [Shewanella chilikensis]|uniref:YbbD head domain-containing protein n=1 Tax=Shewanella chilikensis TaxID=558541 RepID=A0ABX5PJC7_9GAMM|nr:hypothetical protein [Shewanella chilikensis]MCL1155733.1 hypothetical protein [Shewanella chilikensis]PYE55634.1 hypothetical protein C8J23_13639 [Shewanella chilikensis]GGZ41540.1 hypothetical protein GCM10007105_30630 [Shewanella chilikensis]
MKPLMRSLSISSMLTLTALLWGCSDVISEQYPTEAEARAEGVFERGWLPPILPPSATEIKVNNDLDNNSSSGSFRLPAAAISEFTSQLKAEEGLANSWYYREGDSLWIFRLTQNGVIQYQLQ